MKTQHDKNIVNSKGAVVIPAELRDKYNIKPGDEVFWVEESGELKLKRFKSKNVDYTNL